MWVNLIKADEPSANNNVYPESTLKAAISQPPCKVYPAYCKAGDEGFAVDEENNQAIGETLAYRFEDGWFQAQIMLSCPHFASLVKDGVRMVRAAVLANTFPEDPSPDIRRVIISINSIDHLALCDPNDVSWPVLKEHEPVHS